MQKAKENIIKYHEKQKNTGYIICEEKGVVLGRRVLPLEKVGIYVPGGTAAYPSTVLMNALPAKLAGVKEIIMVTPPDRQGTVSSGVLAAAYIAGVDRVFKIGGAQAIGALAYGTEKVPKVDKIVGPGNIYVATAKRLVYGVVDIDMIAGPSEVVIIADKESKPTFVAADLLSQAEHDIMSSSILITDSRELAEEVAEEIEKQLTSLVREEMARKAIESNGRIILVSNMEEAVAISNKIAPEHLEICTEDPFNLLGLVTHAGSVFLGSYSPEPLGDYMAGPNHTLPTSGTARFSSPLSLEDFTKSTSFVYYTEEALEKVSEDIMVIAEREGLQAHGRAVAMRFKR